MTNNELKDTFVSAFAEAHAKVEALPDGGAKTRAQRLLAMFHHAGTVFAEHLVDEGEITPMDGTAKPNP